MKTHKIIPILVLGYLVAVAGASAQITVKAVKGNVAFKKGSAWQKLEKGMSLPEGVAILSASGSFALLDLNGHSVTINPSSSIKVYSHGVSDGKSQSHLGVKHGSVKVKIKKMAAVKTSFKVSTPVATSSVRGTEEVVSYGPAYGMVVDVLSGMVDIGNDRGISGQVSGSQQFQATSSTESKSVLSERQGQSSVDINSPDLTDEEEENFADGNIEALDSPDFLESLLNPEVGENATAVTIQPIWP